ncbi:NAD-dependent epimerase/dehydratase family protein [Actinoplanes sp. L3-i22]|uniref:NAD-dependent epimerase/dehydratase family protein n=1 Tax=Actinoplanes sp. L3-i22 TaxID=2836373 RepID=UPI00351D0BBD
MGGHGYVGSRAVFYAEAGGDDVVVVSRGGDTRGGVPSVAWDDFLIDLRQRAGQPSSIVWILDGAKHDELERLNALLRVVDESTYVVGVSSCTVYGNRHGEVCVESTPLSLVTPNAELKAACEDSLEAAPVSYGILRLGALYGVDDRGIRRDRVEKWVTEAAQVGTVTVPEPSHWRGWLHRDQAARALVRAARDRVEGTFNVTSSNYRFGDAASFAADPFGAEVRGDGKDDPMDYQIDSSLAVKQQLLDHQEGEDLPSTVAAFAATHRR